MAFYDKFEELCKAKGVTPTRAARENGLTQSVISMWKTRGSTPKAATVQKLADYFGVSVGELLGLEYMGGGFWGKEAGPEMYEKLAPNFEKFHGKDALVSVGEEQFPTDGEMLKMNCNAVFAYMEKMTRAGQTMAVKTVKALSEMPEYQKKDAPEQK